MDELFEKQIEEAVDIGEGMANIRALARAIGVPDDDPVLVEAIIEFQEKPFVVICKNIWGRHIFEERAATREGIMELARKFSGFSQSCDDGALNPYRYWVFGPGISEEGINVAA